MFCHGYIAAHMLDDSDDLQQVRAAAGRAKQQSRNAQRKWIAHQLEELHHTGKTRRQAEETIVERIWAMLDRDDFSGEFGRNWFGVILGKSGLASTYHRTKLNRPEMQELISDDSIRIPPLPE